MDGQLYWNGQWAEAAGGERKQVINPATGEAVGSVAVGRREDAAACVEAAADALPRWSGLVAAERANLLFAAYQRLVAQADEIARILTLEQGKPLSEAKGEVLFAAEFLRWYSEEAKRNYGETIPASAPNKRILVIKQPVGVVAAITPWNFPASMVTRKIAPALAAGCTVVLKPADYTPLTAVALFRIFDEAGFPPGVVNLVTGRGREIGAAFMENPKVDKITFTGSTEVGKQLIRASADHVKRVSMELGGHAPFIVFEDADLDQAVKACIVSKFRNAGQTCICANRIYVQDSIMDAFARKLTASVQAMKIGNGMEPGVEIGPMIDKEAMEKADRQVADAVAKGAVLLTGGKPYRPAAGSAHAESLRGCYYEPTVLAHADASMTITQEETFGPVAPLYAFHSEREAIDKANDCEYGLAAYAYTNDLGRAVRVSEALQYGIVGINDALPSVAQAPFGGWKESGIGREGGHYGMEAFLEVKYVSIGV